METPEMALQTAMEALKSLDMETFNDCTDNYIKTYTNWLGIPSEKEYRVFSELLQPRLIRGKRYRMDQKIAEKIVNNLTWEIGEVRKEGERAEIDILITNIDLTDVAGKYRIQRLEDLIKTKDIGWELILKGFSDMEKQQEKQLACMEEAEAIRTVEVTAAASREGRVWKIHLNDSLVNAFLGGMESEHYSEEVEGRLKELEEEYEEKIEQWGDELGERLEEKYEEKIEQWEDYQADRIGNWIGRTIAVFRILWRCVSVG